MTGKAHEYCAITLKTGAAVMAIAVLAATFAAYFYPGFRVELANFWAMCVAALR
jgi:hypothetical protein